MTSDTGVPKTPPRKTKKAGKPKSPVRPGVVLRGRFELLEEIGRGGLSVVFKARDKVAADAGLADPHVALKIIFAGDAVEPDIVSLMHREARRLRDLVHPNIVRVYDMDVEDQMHFMVMEHLNGKTLSKAFREAPEHVLDVRKVNRLVQDVAAALSFSHGRGIVHADLKPGNIFIERNGAVKLIDFNIAFPVARPMKVTEEDTIQILGRLGAVTPAYASPQRLNDAEPCEADDVFSLAVLTYMALSGRRPFGGKTSLEALKEEIAPEPIRGLHRRSWKAIENGLALDDASRTPSAAQFALEFTRSNVFSVANRLMAPLQR